MEDDGQINDVTPESDHDLPFIFGINSNDENVLGIKAPDGSVGYFSPIPFPPVENSQKVHRPCREQETSSRPRRVR